MSVERFRALQERIGEHQLGAFDLGKYSAATAQSLQGHTFDRKALGARGLKYERLDQLTLEVILGVR